MELHDIKPIVEIEEYSIYYASALLLLILIAVIAVGYLLYRYIKHRNRVDIRKVHKQKIEDIDLHNTKQAAYDLTYYGATFKDDTPRHHKHYDLMIHHLEPYKYKKVVDDFDSETLRHIENYKEIMDV
jgi:hypothetical protein